MKPIFTFILLALSTLGISQNTWTEIPTNTNKKLRTISFGSSEVGYVGGNDSLLLKTVDGGITWTELPYTGVEFFPGGRNIVKLNFVTEDVGFMAVGPYSGTYKTTDGGMSWTLVTNPGNMCYNQGLYFWDEQTGFIGGSGCFEAELIASYADGETELAEINPQSFTDGLVVDIDFLDENYGLAASTDGDILKTIDGGLSWTRITVADDHELTSVEIINDTLAYAGFIDHLSGGFGPLVSHDAGESWMGIVELATFFYPDYNDFYDSELGSIYIAAKPESPGIGLLFEHNDEVGWGWYEVAHPLNGISGYNENIVFAVGDSGLVVTNLEVSLGIESNSPSSDGLKTYSNPVRDELSFTLDADNPGTPVQLEVLDLRGRLILHESTLSRTMDVRALSPGIYVVKVYSNGTVYTSRVVKE